MPPLSKTFLVPAFRRRVRSAAATRSRLCQDAIVYLLFGSIAAATTLAVGWVLYQPYAAHHLPYWLTTSLAAACGLLISFLLNYLYFRFEERSVVHQFGTFAIVSWIGVLLTGALSQALLVPFHLLLAHQGFGTSVAPKFAAHFTAVALMVLYSFPAHRFISFNVGLRARFDQLVRREAPGPTEA
jgi:putative flippase GtrA